MPNARSLFLHLDAELARCRRTGVPLTLLVCDLDGFKQVNDRFGHLEGNRVLQTVAASLRDACRQYDYVARMGGDEFVLVIPGLTADKVPAKVRQLRLLAAEAGSQVGGQRVPVDRASGRLIRVPTETTRKACWRQADRRMYKAKRSIQMEPATAGLATMAAQFESTSIH